MYQEQVSFKTAVVRGLNNLINFSGRASRSEYWWFQLFVFLLYMIFYVALAIKIAVSNDIPDAGQMQYSSLLLITGLMSLSLTVRRLHDIGKSGFWYFIQFIPVIGSIILLIWTLKNSEMFDNRFGPVPNLVMQ